MIKTCEGFWVSRRHSRSRRARARRAGRRKRRPGRRGADGSAVEVVVARADTVRDEIAATGRSKPLQSIDLRPEVDGRVVEILIARDRRSSRGRRSSRLDDAQLKHRSHSSRRSAIWRSRRWRAQDLAQAERLRGGGPGEGRGERAAPRPVRPAADPARAHHVRAPFGRRWWASVNVSLGDYAPTAPSSRPCTP